MCGRYALVTTGGRLQRIYELRETPRDLVPRFNIAPSQDVPVVRAGAEGERTLAMLRWGLLPRWAKDPKDGPHPINARAETAHERPMFRDALARRRCLLPADGFYEWKREGRHKQPYYIRLKEEEPFAMAGIWEQWAPPGAEPIESVAILTTAANSLVADIHDRMPVIVDPADYDLWTAHDVHEAWALAAVLGPLPAERMEAYPVSERVNDPKNDNPECIEPKVP